jgi:hypothetical protein
MPDILQGNNAEARLLADERFLRKIAYPLPLEVALFLIGVPTLFYIARQRAKKSSREDLTSDRRGNQVSSGNLAHGGVRVSEPGRNAISPGRPV